MALWSPNCGGFLEFEGLVFQAPMQRAGLESQHITSSVWKSKQSRWWWQPKSSFLWEEGEPSWFWRLILLPWCLWYNPILAYKNYTVVFACCLAPFLGCTLLNIYYLMFSSVQCRNTQHANSFTLKMILEQVSCWCPSFSKQWTSIRQSYTVSNMLDSLEWTWQAGIDIHHKCS